MSVSDTIRAWRLDPVKFVRDNFKIEPDAWQAEALTALRPTGVTRLCLKACAGPGKTAMLAWVGWWFLGCFGDVGCHPKGAAVAITADNLGDNLWPELSKWRSRSPYLMAAFDWQKTRVFAKDHPDTWFLSARSFSKTANETEQGSTLSGLHSEYPFVLLDETGGMSPAIGRAAEQAMGNCRAGLIIQAGNPISKSGLLYETSVSNRKDWAVVTITADPDDPKRTPRVDKAWAQKQIDQHGRDNPWVQAYILGLFPATAFNALLGSDQVEACLGRVLAVDSYNFSARVMGIDAARFGDDRWSVCRRQGKMWHPPKVLSGVRTEEVAAVAMKEYLEFHADAVFVDGTGGYGGGLVDALRLVNVPVIEIQFAGKALDPRYANCRAEMWFEMAKDVKAGCSLPQMAELVRELTAPTYVFTGGKFQLEAKEQIKARLGYSPDIADGFALTYAQPVIPRDFGTSHLGLSMPSAAAMAAIDQMAGTGQGIGQAET